MVLEIYFIALSSSITFELNVVNKSSQLYVELDELPPNEPID